MHSSGNQAQICARFSLSPELLDYLVSSMPNYRIVQEYLVDERSGDLSQNPQVKRLLELLGGGFVEERELIEAGVGKDTISLAVKRRLVHRLGDFLFVSDTFLEKLVEDLKELGDSFTVQEAKGKLGLSRKYLIPLLEYLDYMGLTRREGNVRRWRHAQGHRP